MRQLQLLFLAIILGLFFIQCRKGKKLPHQTALNIQTNLTQIPSEVSSNYFHSSPSSEFNEYTTELKKYLAQNNIKVEAAADYEFQIARIDFGETVERKFYFDTCSNYDRFAQQYDTSWYSVSTIRYSVMGELRKNGQMVHYVDASIQKQEKCRERTTRNGCKRVHVRNLWCGGECLRRKVAKEVRKQITQAIFRNETW